MATVEFGAVAADMRLEANWYGIPQLQAFDTFLQGFVPSSQTIITQTPTLLVVSQEDVFGQTVTVSLSGNVEFNVFTQLEIQATGITLALGGSFFTYAVGNLFGTVTSESASFTAGNALIARIAGVSIPTSSIDLVDPQDAVVLSGADTITGGSGSDFLLGYAGNDRLAGGPGADTLAGGADNDTYVLDDAGDVVTEAVNEGTDTVRISASHTLGDNVENLVLLGTAAINGTGNALSNAIDGNAGNNILDGAAGDDTLRGGRGDDTLLGGLGNDVFSVDSTLDVIGDSGGVDKVLSSASCVLTAGLEDLALLGSGNIDGTGNALNNVLTGNAGDNVLRGGAGDDTLTGGLGMDFVVGGLGNDTYIVNTTLPSTMLSLAGQPGDYVSGGQSFFFTPDTGSFSVIGLFDGTGDGLIDSVSILYAEPGFAHHVDVDIGTSGLGQNLAPGTYLNAERTFFASPGHPGLNVDVDSRGANRVFGSFSIQEVNIDNSSGSPVLLAFSATFEQHAEIPSAPALFGTIRFNATPTVDETVVEASGGGIDRVLSSGSFDLPANVENLKLTGSAAVDGTGNGLDNVITGNEAANALSGGAGNDVITGGGGGDTLTGGAGSDFLDGGAGVDTASYANSTAPVTVSLSLTGPQNTLGAGTDRLLGFENLTGSDFADRLAGDSSDNVLEGHGGNDSLDGGGGVDTASYALAAAGVSVNLSLEIAQDTLGAGTDLLLGFENLAGSDFADRLTGDSSDNILEGRGGNDILDGGGGVDTASYALAAAGVSVMLSLANAQDTRGAGTDTLIAIKNLLGSRFGDRLNGSFGNNLLDGGASVDELHGAEGNDTLIGGAGADILLGEAGNDTLVFDAADLSVDGGKPAVGTDVDTLRVDGSGVLLNLSGLAGFRLNDLEQINLRGTGNNTLILTAADVVDLSTTSNQLVVLGNAGDVVSAGAGWTQGANQTIGAQDFATYTKGLATLLVDIDVTRNIAA